MMGLGRAYIIEFHAVSIAAQQDFFYLKPAADKPIFLEEFKLANVGGTADAGDAQEEQLGVEIVYLPATVTVGSGGTAFTPVPVAINDAAAGFTARINDTTKATTSGTASWRDSDGWNPRSPFIYTPIPEHRRVVTNAAAIVVRLNTTPADAFTANGTAVVREIP
jgi:hypothetical protein